MAQTTTTTTTQQPAVTQPAAPAAPAAETDTTKKSTSTQAKSDQPAKPVKGQIVLQDKDSILASTLIGSTVYSPANETVGDINDLIVGLDGKVQGVVIGVGGFLGLGEKDVAVKMDQITVQPEDANKSNVRLILASTKADLEAAPEFKSVAAQNREMNSNTGSTTMPAAPATPPASTGTTNQ
ncbi:MAG TPA: PRC-barrel domain-containing protein [Aestuariivirgaceae bacterium]|nr:PRC-barrel domain-containing protein [Aestuariivirgaceae bacterium]